MDTRKLKQDLYIWTKKYEDAKALGNTFLVLRASKEIQKIYEMLRNETK